MSACLSSALLKLLLCVVAVDRCGFVQVQPISMTDGMSISSGKNVLKLDVGMVVEALGMPGTQDSTCAES